MARVPAVRVSPAELRAATAALAPADRAEMAVPSYSHPNPLIRWLFWQRLDTAVRFADLGPGASVLDFGTGSGILLPTLAAVAKRIVATDIELAPSQATAKARSIKVEFVTIPDFRQWTTRNPGSLECIFALDVLEHVETEELLDLSGAFRSLLRPGGRLIVSGPTETMFYKLGRKLAGFKNEYHHRNIFDIDRVLVTQWRIAQRTYLPRFPLPRAFVLTRYE
jgi:2-polyprenyl-3-methyl-5-hydroxy-6-metoxy-1,4-benzoquinol methylase